jgi:hypothetical protein
MSNDQHLLDCDHVPRNAVVAIVLLAAVLVGCGGDDDARADTSASENTSSPSAPPTTTATPSPTSVTVPRPDVDWSTTLIEEYQRFLDGDLERNLTFLDAVAATPEREVELFSDYLRDVSAAMSDMLESLPSVPTESEAGSAAAAFRAALEDRRDQLDELASEVDAVAGPVQADLDRSDDRRYAEFRSILADDRSADACFDLQQAFDRAGLGLLGCIPTTEGEPAPITSGPAPTIDLGPDATTVVLEFDFDDDAAEPSGEFEVSSGADELGCGSGTWVDRDLSDDLVVLTKELTCTEGERAGTIVVEQRQVGSDLWIVRSGTGAFVGLVAQGTGSYDPSTGTEVWEGGFSLPD